MAVAGPTNLPAEGTERLELKSRASHLNRRTSLWEVHNREASWDGVRDVPISRAGRGSSVPGPWRSPVVLCLGTSLVLSGGLPAAADPGSVFGAITGIEMKSDDANSVVVNSSPFRSDGVWYIRQGSAATSVWWFVNVSIDPRAYTCTPQIYLDGQPTYQGGPLTPQQTDFGVPRMLWHYDGGGLTRLNSPGFIAFASKVRTGTANITFNCKGNLGQANWSMPVSVIPAPPAGREGGVSINDGADFTNQEAVRLFLGWENLGSPEGMIDKVKVSNDGGFAPSKSKEFTLQSTDPISWKLVKLGNERLPKQVYVKFHQAGGSWLKQTYSDDILLDTVKPEVQSATVRQPQVAALSAAGATLRIRARDNRSGLAALQLRYAKKKSKAVKYRKRLSVKGTPKRVRVRDGAGNWSTWARIS